jgi:uncharacterized protein (DUF427 family)
MSAKPIKQPSPSHPITIERNPARVRVSVAGRTLVDTREALTLREADYLPVQYVPLADVDGSLLTPSDHESYCPFKGECNYYSVPIGGERAVNAVWEYKAPYPAVAEIAGHVAFYRDRVELVEELDSQAAPA